VVSEQAAPGALPGRVLSEEVQRGLREAFAREVAARLPHLRRADDWELVRHDAHSLASSAWVVGEHAISVLARSVEDQLGDGRSPEGLTDLVAALEAVPAP